eukprot:Plantae.Rhodophyta-Purpureofilum_apyrenoidigerum.ctg17651.p1 GENE.Plantae.Rhodophyta-Purpureofilum_apyrenoidigerum.ctg17651~~Plantae.Rhodophyta-Purpureofilum_apyrenoidigerum.ctg17651.p1  ORF type:complete len:272 (+),score=52.65 Plantae.Rhodophyta-Purpureofilum_apyrenoidigerum.ctg17651:133-948(+)
MGVESLASEAVGEMSTIASTVSAEGLTPRSPPPECQEGELCPGMEEELCASLEKMDAEEVLAWTASNYGRGMVVTTSFGIQSAVILHMVKEHAPEATIVWVDTGYHPEETYKYAETLMRELNLNLRMYQAEMSPARMEAIYGKLWESGDLESLKLYNRIRKVEPLQRAFDDLNATAWVTGVRKSQTDYRQTLKSFMVENGRAKIMPLLDWSSRDVAVYLKKHNLPKHPLEEKGYTTVGDWHSSRPLNIDDLRSRDTRFMGLMQECGIHTTF